MSYVFNGDYIIWRVCTVKSGQALKKLAKTMDWVLREASILHELREKDEVLSESLPR